MKGPTKISKMSRLLEFLYDNVGKSEIVQKSDTVDLCAGAKKTRVSRQLFDHGLDHGLIRVCVDQASLTFKGKKTYEELSPHSKVGKNGSTTEKISVDVDGSTHIADLNIHESPLMRLFSRKNKQGISYLKIEHLRAGECFRRDFELGQLQPKITATLDMSFGVKQRGASMNSAGEISDFALDKRKTFYNAVEYLGDDLSGVCTDVCCFLKGLETVERERRWPPRSAKLMLRTGLSLLVDFYGLGPMCPEKHGKRSVWRDKHFKPKMFSNH